MSGHIYVIAHKDFVPRSVDDTRITLGVGGFVPEGGLSANRFLNIEYLNPKINELTGMYWIWKNTYDDWIGVEHYRRTLSGEDGSPIQSREIEELLKENDIILRKIFYHRMPLHRLLKILCKYDYAATKEMIEQSIAEHQPEYLNEWLEMQNDEYGYICNLMIMPRNLFNEYMEWITSIVLPVAEKFNHNSRAVGYFAEALLNVWIQHISFKIKEVGVFE